jgi:hypothetical protein
LNTDKTQNPPPTRKFPGWATNVLVPVIGGSYMSCTKPNTIQCYQTSNMTDLDDEWNIDPDDGEAYTSEKKRRGRYWT